MRGHGLKLHQNKVSSDIRKTFPQKTLEQDTQRSGRVTIPGRVQKTCELRTWFKGGGAKVMVGVDDCKDCFQQGSFFDSKSENKVSTSNAFPYFQLFSVQLLI